MRWREAKDLPPGRHRLASPYDVDARYSVKRGSGWCGYKTHLSETCEAHAPHVITHVVTTDAAVGDTEVTEEVHQSLAARELLPDEHIVDAGYVTATHIVTARDEHGIDLLGPVGLDTVHERHEGEHIPQSAFNVDRDARKVTCPH
ncbi:IS1182 family transposase, partial [Kitasatospora sp. NPDC058218]